MQNIPMQNQTYHFEIESTKLKIEILPARSSG